MTSVLIIFGWCASGVVGVRMILNWWFSGALEDLRPTGFPIRYILIGLVGGPINILLATFWIMLSRKEGK